MSITNGPICSSDASYGDLTSDGSGFLLSTKGSTLRIITPHTPAASNEAGYVGEHKWDTGYLYICVATNTWKRVALATF
jgi:hypothetical protein